MAWFGICLFLAYPSFFLINELGPGSEQTLCSALVLDYQWKDCFKSDECDYVALDLGKDYSLEWVEPHGFGFFSPPKKGDLVPIIRGKGAFRLDFVVFFWTDPPLALPRCE